MLGWLISTYRMNEPGPLAGIEDVGTLLIRFPTEVEQAALHSALRHRKEIAVWQTGIGGLKWIDDMVGCREALALLSNGYPNAYLVQARRIVSALLAGPPHALQQWTLPHYVVPGPTWYGRTVVDRHAAEACDPDEWLLVQAWDES